MYASYQGLDSADASKAFSVGVHGIGTSSNTNSISNTPAGVSTGAESTVAMSLEHESFADSKPAQSLPRKSPRTGCVQLDRTSDDRTVQEWLLENKFDPQTAVALSGYTAMELFDISKEDLKALVGTKDGIRLHTKLKQIKEVMGSDLSPQAKQQLRCQAAALMGSAALQTPRRHENYGSLDSVYSSPVDHEYKASSFGRREASEEDQDADDEYSNRNMPMTPQIAATRGISTVFQMPMSFVPDFELSPSASPARANSEGSRGSRYSTPRYRQTRNSATGGLTIPDSTSTQLLAEARRAGGHCVVPRCKAPVFATCSVADCGYQMCLEHSYKEIITGYTYCPQCYEVYAPLNVATRKIRELGCSTH